MCHQTRVRATQTLFFSPPALTFPHLVALRSTKPHLASPSKAVRLNEPLSAIVLLLLRPEAALFRGRRPGGGVLWFGASFRKRAVVEHKAQTHFGGFVLLFLLLC